MDRRREGRPIIDLTESNPTRAGFDYPSDLLAPLADRRGLTYVPEALGLREARQAVAADYARRGANVEMERIVLTASTSEAYSLLFKLLVEPGDEVLVPRPSYPLFELLTSLDGVATRAYDLEYDGGWSIDFASVERNLGPQTRALLLVNPNNPTGSFVSREELDRLATLCGPRDVALIADEVFGDYQLEATARPAQFLDRCDVLVFSLGGLSKSVGLPQVKLGWMAIAGPSGVVSQTLERLEVVCDTYLSVSTPVQLAAAELLDRGRAIRRQISERLRVNYQKLNELAASWPSCRVLPAAGGWYAVVQVPTLRTEEDLVVCLLNEDGVLVHPGYFFDFPRESFLVVSLLVPEESFNIGAERLFRRAVL
jgi:alanine-synthesizing transaminase